MNSSDQTFFGYPLDQTLSGGGMERCAPELWIRKMVGKYQGFERFSRIKATDYYTLED